MRRQKILVMMICMAVAAQAQILPGDGSNLTVCGLDTEIRECGEGVCDLSSASVIGDTEMRFEYYGDSLVRRVAGMSADWFRIDGDTILCVGSDTRRDNIRYSHGLPYLLPYQSADTSDSLRHSVFMTIDRDNMISCRYSSHRSCGFILPGGDTIQTTYCIETEVCDTAATVRHQRWYADGMIWPVVEQVNLRIGDEEYHTVNICPPANQPSQRRAAKGKTARQEQPGIYNMLAQLHGSDPVNPTASAIADFPYTIALNPSGISVTGADNAIARLFDTSGRLWHEGPATETIPTSHVAAGVYLVQISSDTESYTTKLTITGH